jgi:hypothetical protein
LVNKNGSLIANNQKLYEEWDYENNKIDPEHYTIGSSKKVWWICKKCGHKWKASINNRSHGSGCNRCNSSKGENKLISYFVKNNIEYIVQKRFKECKNKLTLPFDFYLPQYNLLIEYQGIQHYEIITACNWYKTKQEKEKVLKLSKKKDKIKRDFCKSKKIRLLAIPYTYYDKIENILNKFFETNKLPRLKKPSMK